ncbi:monoacylglycerol lipase ABHD6-like [Heteronotia binoei]|uniref:monoacylglycerol lipase ABHD6-like n=1 Tax=Heteronotia binoei TaxID=13085 RepID=UPI00293045AD|nr:monoacylglycerol lipase ABHD6-like [Heteronotia binoei]
MDFILLKTPLIFIGFLLITFLIIYFLWPEALVRFGRWVSPKILGLQVRYAEHNGYRFCYYSRGKPGLQPSMLMLHGYAFDKDTWLTNMNFLPKNIHVVCLDLPGHGGTTCLPGDSYTTYDQVKRLHQFVECTGLNRKPFHLVGISMGGMVAGVYAAQYPSDVCCVSLLCPTGLKSPKDSDIMKQMKEKRKKHDVSLVPSNIQEGIEMFRLGLSNPCSIPKQLIKGLTVDWLADNNFFRKCYLDIFNDESLYSLQDNISKIKVPTQVIWGKDDRMVDVSGAEVLAKDIPHAQVHLLEKCGHFQPMDSPKETSQLLLDFHTSYMKNFKKA